MVKLMASQCLKNTITTEYCALCYRSLKKPLNWCREFPTSRDYRSGGLTLSKTCSRGSAQHPHGEWLPDSLLPDTGRQQTVYNFRVAESPPDSIAPAVQKSSPMTSRPYTDPANLFTLDLPAEWRLERPEQGPIRMACLARRACRPDSVQDCAANVNAGVHPLAPLTTDEYVTLCRLQLRQLSGQPRTKQRSMRPRP